MVRPLLLCERGLRLLPAPPAPPNDGLFSRRRGDPLRMEARSNKSSVSMLAAESPSSSELSPSFIGTKESSSSSLPHRMLRDGVHIASSPQQGAAPRLRVIQ